MPSPRTIDSYLKGREQAAQRYTAKLPPPKHKGQETQEQIIQAEPMPDVTSAPKVDLVMSDGIVRRIVIHLPGGQRLELECEYGTEEKV